MSCPVKGAGRVRYGLPSCMAIVEPSAPANVAKRSSNVTVLLDQDDDVFESASSSEPWALASRAREPPARRLRMKNMRPGRTR